MDKTVEKVFINNFESTRLIARRLQFSQKKLSRIFPLSPSEISQIGDDTQESLDALLKRFEQLEESVESKLFRGILLLEQEDLSGKSKRDITILMEKFGILEKADSWSYLSLLRNKLAHNYPNSPESQSERINDVYTLIDYLISVLDQVKKYVTEKKLIKDMREIS